MDLLKTLMGCIRQYKRVSILTPVYAAMEVFMEVLIPFVTAMLIDKGIETGNMTNVLLYGLLMLVLAMLSLFFGVRAGQYGAHASAGFAANLRGDMYRNIQTFSFSNIDKFSTAGLVTRLTTDVTNVQNAFQMILRIAVRAPMTFICSIIMCIYIDAKISMIFLVAVVFLAAVLAFIMTKTRKIFAQLFEKYDALNASVQENISAIRVVKAFVREGHEDEKFRAAAQLLRDFSVRAESLLALNSPAMMLAIYGCIIGIAWMGAHNIVNGSMTTGELTSMFSYVMSVMSSLMMLSMVFVMLTMSIASGKRISEVLNEKADITDPEAPVKDIPDGRVDFNHVSFAYKTGTGADTLRDIDIHIKSGETIGIIGGTGCGKSSLVNLISRLYDVNQGSVCVGGIDVRKYGIEPLRDSVSVVLQKNVLFSGTIIDNLRWGNANATETDCAEACANACADEFIDRMPDKYNTYIEQGGTNVSGGQKQRLCIARALMKKPKVLILDDSTSAVDTATDARIREAFAKHIPGTTKLIISQRISSVKDADRILVLDDGTVNGFDSHENLLRTNAIYREIYDTQTKGGGDFDAPKPEGKGE